MGRDYTSSPRVLLVPPTQVARRLVLPGGPRQPHPPRGGVRGQTPSRFHVPLIGHLPGMAWLASLPVLIRILIWVAIACVIIWLLALIISPTGGFDWAFHIGKFHWDIGIT